MKKKYAQKYAQIQKQIRFLPLLLIALLVLSGVFGTWYVKADDANDPEWRLEAELLSEAEALSEEAELLSEELLELGAICSSVIFSLAGV